MQVKVISLRKYGFDDIILNFYGIMPRTGPFILASSNSFWALSSISRISAMVKPYQLSIQQNTSRWNFVNRRGYCLKHL
ncbi:unnamed protein product [Brugia timori]|uniref:Uncharacterized protein n=1 Tax=Brugia timori TaxID=42155 RepID=A0A0R3QKE8_9BILA|nr:unnamed protein product [Brugia timori]